MKIQLQPTLNRLAATVMTMTVRVLPDPSRNCLKAKKKSMKGKLYESIR